MTATVAMTTEVRADEKMVSERLMLLEFEHPTSDLHIDLIRHVCVTGERVEFTTDDVDLVFECLDILDPYYDDPVCVTFADRDDRGVHVILWK